MEDVKYMERKEYHNVVVAQNLQGKWGVIDRDGNEIVPFGKYAWIDGFDGGLARVRTAGLQRYVERNVTALFDDDLNPITDRDEMQHHLDVEYSEHPERFSTWGIINTDGEEVLPVLYDSVWNFRGKYRRSTNVVKDGEMHEVFFRDLPGSIWFVEHDFFEEPEVDYDCDCFSIDNCYDFEGNFDYEALEDAILDGEYVPEDW